MKTLTRLLTLGLVLALGSGVLAPVARADVFVMNDGSEIDGHAIREAEGTLWVRLITDKVVKISAANVKERRAGKSAIERVKELEIALKKDAKNAGFMWELYELLAPHDDKALVKRRRKLMKKLLKADPDHAKARAAHGDVKFEGRWVAKRELERIKVEAAREKKKKAWKKRLGIDFDLYESEHYTFLDAAGEKDLIGRSEQMEKAYDALKEVLQLEKLWSGRCVVITLSDDSLYQEALREFQKTWNMKDWWVKAARANTGVWRQIPRPVILRHTGKSEDMMWSAIIHSTAHLAMWTLHRRNVPAWLEEGLGAWVEIEVTDEHLTSCVGDKNASKGHTTDKRPGGKKGKGKNVGESFSMWRELLVEQLSDGEFTSLRKFLGMDLGEFEGAHEGGALALVTFLIGKGSEKFSRCVKALKGMPKKKTDRVWKDVYEYEQIEEMEKEWRTWVLSSW